MSLLRNDHQALREIFYRSIMDVQGNNNSREELPEVT